MLKILHFADIHYGMENYGLTDPASGLSSRLLDWNKSFGELIKYALNTPVDAVLFAGDGFKTRDPNPTYQNAFFKGLKKIAGAGIPVIIIPGNHDLPVISSKKSALETLVTLKVPNIYFSKKIELIKVALPRKKALLQIATLPFIYKLNICAPNEIKGLSAEKLNQVLTKRLENLVSLQAAKMRRDQPRILLAHLSVEKAMLGSEQMIGFGQDLLLSQDFLKNLALDYIALGHLHKYQLVLPKPLTIYPGSLERIDFSEENETKGFVEINFSPNQGAWQAKAHFIPVPARKFLTLKIKINRGEKNPQNQVVKDIKQADIKDAVLRIMIQATDEQARNISDLALKEAASQAYLLGPIIKQTDRLKTDQSADISKTPEVFSKTPAQNVKSFIRSLNISPAQKQKLTALANKIIEEVEENP